MVILKATPLPPLLWLTLHKLYWLSLWNREEIKGKNGKLMANAGWPLLLLSSSKSYPSSVLALQAVRVDSRCRQSRVSCSKNSPSLLCEDEDDLSEQKDDFIFYHQSLWQLWDNKNIIRFYWVWGRTREGCHTDSWASAPSCWHFCLRLACRGTHLQMRHPWEYCVGPVSSEAWKQHKLVTWTHDPI